MADGTAQPSKGHHWYYYLILFLIIVGVIVFISFEAEATTKSPIWNGIKKALGDTATGVSYAFKHWYLIPLAILAMPFLMMVLKMPWKASKA